MTTTDDLTALKLQGRTGLLAAVPALLGFHPRESLVMICMSGPRRRIGPVIRVDASDRSPGLPATLTAHAERYADEVAFALYTERPRTSLLSRTLAVLESAKIPVLDALVIRGGRAWPIESFAATGRENDGVVEPGGSFSIPDGDDPQVQAVSAAIALHGRGILPDREALAHSIAGPAGAAADQSAQAFRRAADDLLTVLERERMTNPDPLVRFAEQVAEEALGQTEQHGRVDLDRAAQLALYASDVAARDALVARAVTEVDARWLPMLISVSGQVLDRDAAGLSCLLALTAYRHGDGALAQVAVDRCLAAEPDYRLGHLLLAAMAAGMPPAQLTVLAADRSDDRAPE